MSFRNDKNERARRETKIKWMVQLASSSASYSHTGNDEFQSDRRQLQQMLLIVRPKVSVSKVTNAGNDVFFLVQMLFSMRQKPFTDNSVKIATLIACRH